MERIFRRLRISVPQRCINHCLLEILSIIAFQKVPSGLTICKLSCHFSLRCRINLTQSGNSTPVSTQTISTFSSCLRARKRSTVLSLLPAPSMAGRLCSKSRRLINDSVNLIFSRREKVCISLIASALLLRLIST